MTSSVLGVIVGILAAYALNRSGRHVRDAMMTFVSICVNFAGVPPAFAFIIILGVSGILSTLLSKYFGVDLYGTGLSLVYLYLSLIHI